MRGFFDLTDTLTEEEWQELCSVALAQEERPSRWPALVWVISIACVVAIAWCVS